MLTNSTRYQQMQKCTPKKNYVKAESCICVPHIQLSASSLMALLSCEHKTVRFET